MITTSQLRELVGHQVVMGFEDSMWGATTLRWGTLREISPDGATLRIDGYHDSAGIGFSIARPEDGVPVEVSSTRFIKRYYPGSIR